ncbi:MAG: hypothetical protein V7675_05005 [Hyphomonas sp.]|uniref:hypothetical protein n=1 Tax=Hyphomonas sp. TaxID=87 RepID=UPI0030010BF1
MKNALILTALLSGTMLLGACASNAAAKERQQIAWSRCASSPGPVARESCVTTQLALLEAADRAEAESLAAKQRSYENRDAEREASGMSPEMARGSSDPGIQLPR